MNEGSILKDYIRNQMRIKAKELARRGAEKSRKSVDASYSFLRRTFEKEKLDRWEVDKLRADYDIDFSEVISHYSTPTAPKESALQELQEENLRLKDENAQLKMWIERLLNLLDQRDNGSSHKIE